MEPPRAKTKAARLPDGAPGLAPCVSAPILVPPPRRLFKVPRGCGREGKRPVACTRRADGATMTIKRAAVCGGGQTQVIDCVSRPELVERSGGHCLLARAGERDTRQTREALSGKGESEFMCEIKAKGRKKSLPRAGFSRTAPTCVGKATQVAFEEAPSTRGLAPAHAHARRRRRCRRVNRSPGTDKRSL